MTSLSSFKTWRSISTMFVRCFRDFCIKKSREISHHIYHISRIRHWSFRHWDGAGQTLSGYELAHTHLRAGTSVASSRATGYHCCLLTFSKTRFCSGPGSQESLHGTQEVVYVHPILTILDSSHQFVAKIDASSTGVVGVLSQKSTSCTPLNPCRN